ncbi:MAG: hypothetical protein QXX77_04735 [Candidatus Methanosuratincola sp.]
MNYGFFVIIIDETGLILSSWGLAEMYCDKCGKKVELKNSARVFQYIVDYGRIPDFGVGTFLMGSSDRHLLPVPGCDGSPSRNQYLEGMPRDPRSKTYRVELEEKYRHAYQLLQTLDDDLEAGF